MWWRFVLGAAVEARVSPGGRVRGVLEDGIATFHAVPYAQPPTASRRWRPPLPARPWPGVRSAEAPGPACWQSPDFDPPVFAMSEDCLTATVYAPHPVGAPVPVVVWCAPIRPSALGPWLMRCRVHGGGNTGGWANETRLDGRRLLQSAAGRRLPVVVVVVQYRLGIFGWLGGDALR